MTDNRFYYASKGTNCLDGEPNEKWMTFSTTNNLGIGKICGDDDLKYIPTPADIKYRDGFRVSKRISNGSFEHKKNKSTRFFENLDICDTLFL